MKLRLLGAVCACLANVAQATSTSSAAYDWTTFAVTADGTNITDSISWSYQADYIDTRYIEGAISGTQIENFHDIDPNPNWAAIQQTNDGGANTDAIATVTPDRCLQQQKLTIPGRQTSSWSGSGHSPSLRMRSFRSVSTTACSQK